MKWIIIFLLLVGTAQAQDFSGGFFDFGSNFSSGTYNDTDFFSGPSILGASDFTVQRAFQTLDASGVTLITACQITDEFCFKFVKSILTLYVGGTAQQQWPISVSTIVLLEDGTNLLLEDGSFMLLE